MPRGQKPEGERAMSNAERQARYRDRHLTQPPPVVIRTAGRSTGAADLSVGMTRSTCCGIQGECVDWLAALPDSLRGTAMAEALEAIADLDLSALTEVNPARLWARLSSNEG